MDLAVRLNAEIVSADSRQVYRYMDIGTAKPTIAERARVPHHLIDVVYPTATFSIASYQGRAQEALKKIRSAGRIALVVGGSPHYMQALVDGLEPGPTSTSLRAWLERSDRSRASDLDRWLRELDPEAADRIDLRNRRRVIRALEVTLLTGRRFSEAGRRRSPSLPVLRIGLRLPREVLHQRIERRLTAMLEAGWLDEVRRLLMMGFAPTLPALSATGYPEMVAVVEGRLSLDEAVLRTQHATNSFLRRQETWLRADDRIEWLDASGAPEEIADRLLAAHPELEA
jgi:tRNA dimethylallyltransferase